MLRAVFITGSLVHGGAERHTIGLMNRLAERGHECHAAYVKDDRSQLDRIRLRGKGTVHGLEAGSYYDAQAVDRLSALLVRLKPSVIVAANPYALFYATLARRRARCDAPLVVTFHSTRLLGWKEYVQMAYYRACFWLAEATVFVSERQRRHWLLRGVLSRRNEVIHNGVDTRHYFGEWNGASRVAQRTALGYGEDDYVVALPAVLRPEKNPVALVEAVATLRARGVRAHALFIGDGPMRPAIEAHAKALGIEGAVRISGMQLEVRPWLAAADVVTICSHTEAFSLAAIEAMALHKPVVHSDVGGAGEMIRPGWNGFLFTPGDAKGFAARLEQLATRALRLSLGENARHVVEERFSESRMVDRYEQLLVDVARGHQSIPVLKMKREAP